MRHKHRGNLCEAWSDFWQFVQDVGERPYQDARLERPNKSGPYGPNNFEWSLPLTVIPKGITGKEYNKLAQRQFRARNPYKAKQYAFKAAYGLAIEQYDAMRVTQGDLCAICHRPETTLNKVTLKPRNLAVDHCHATGKVRALLCSQCNGGLGNFGDDIKRLRAAIAYLEKHVLPTPAG